MTCSDFLTGITVTGLQASRILKVADISSLSTNILKQAHIYYNVMNIIVYVNIYTVNYFLIETLLYRSINNIVAISKSLLLGVSY